ncbi:Retrotransposon-derived protein PEG10 [Smittium mucronatum]|uniref:Retrotransposon-derived protein PEG10 n=1 Tax=Smittium mucronatum TaxID=133383 RepID=A0A1R0GNX7_9FUNG|nr:Retrotransposon-derived protein PEG10 [Smittium mucronatum]
MDDQPQNTVLQTQRVGRSVATYSAEYRVLARESGYDQLAPVDQYSRALNKNIISYLITNEPPETLEEGIEIAVRMDNRLEKRDTLTENQGYEFPSQQHGIKDQPKFVNTYTATQVPDNGSIPMDLDFVSYRPRGPLYTDEKSRRYYLGLCVYCGGKGHISLECPNRRDTGKERAQK